MGIRDFFSIYISKFVIILSKFITKGGSNFPGKIALKISPNVLKRVTKNYNIILITGTNGKTTTTSMIYNTLKLAGCNVITNSTGANMFTGITSTFIKYYKPKKSDKNYAIIEVDEANLKFITKYCTPTIIVITNLFRDQLDRYGEIYSTLQKILEGIKDPLSTLIFNGDEPLLGDLGLANKTKFFGLQLENNNGIDINAEGKFCIKCKSPYEYNFISYNHLGDYFCPNCGYSRPAIDYSVDDILEMTPSSSLVTIENTNIDINIGGLYNVYNAICAYSVCKEIGITSETIAESLKNQESSFGRQEILDINNKKVKIILVKNPSGYNEALNTISLNRKDTTFTFLLNDNYADGKDISWIWDVNFELIPSMSPTNIFIGGLRKYDMAIRLKVAGLDPKTFSICDSYDILLEKIKTCDDDFIYVLATYTAMIDFRKFLYNNKYIKKLW